MIDVNTSAAAPYLPFSQISLASLQARRADFYHALSVLKDNAVHPGL